MPRPCDDEKAARDGWRCRPMNAELTSEAHFAEVNRSDPLYRDLQLRGYNRRFVGTPDSVFVVDDTDQVVNAVDAVVASGKKLAVGSGGHCTEGFVDYPAVHCVLDLGQMDSVYYDRHRRCICRGSGERIIPWHPRGVSQQTLGQGWNAHGLVRSRFCCSYVKKLMVWGCSRVGGAAGVGARCGGRGS